MNTAANPIPSADSGRAAAAPVELPDPVSLQILVKALAASAAAVATSRFGAQLAAVSAVVATLVADAVKDVAKRRRWGRKRLAALTGLLLLFSSVDKAFARFARRLGLFRHPKAESLSGWPRVVATSAAAVGIAVAVLTPPEAALGHSLGTGGRSYTFLPHDVPLSQVRPTNLEPPAISGAPIVGKTLRADPGEWSARPEPRLSVRWLLCDAAGDRCVRVNGATLATLRLEAGARTRHDPRARRGRERRRQRGRAIGPVRAGRIGSVSICSFTAGSSGARDTTCFTLTVAGSEPTRASGSGSAFASDDAAGQSGTAVRHSSAPTRASGAATFPGCAPAEQHRSSVDRRACASRRDASGPARSVERQ